MIIRVALVAYREHSAGAHPALSHQQDLAVCHRLNVRAPIVRGELDWANE